MTTHLLPLDDDGDGLTDDQRAIVEFLRPMTTNAGRGLVQGIIDMAPPGKDIVAFVSEAIIISGEHSPDPAKRAMAATLRANLTFTRRIVAGAFGMM